MLRESPYDIKCYNHHALSGQHGNHNYPGTPSVTPDETPNEVVDNNGARRSRIVTQQESDFFKDFENGREVVRREEYSREWVTLEGFSEIAGDVIIEGAGRIFRVAGRLRNFGLPVDGRVEITTTGEEERWSEHTRTATYRLTYTEGSEIPRSVEIDSTPWQRTDNRQWHRTDVNVRARVTDFELCPYSCNNSQ